MSVSSEWFIITAKFHAGRYRWILPPLLKKYEDSQPNFDPSTREKKLEPYANANVSFPPFLLTYHIVMGGVRLLKALAETCHIIWRNKQTQNGQTITFVKTVIPGS